MTFVEITLIALGLAMDCLAVSLGIGTNSAHKSIRTVFRLAFHFGLFQGGMCFLGWLAGSHIVHLISNFDHWIAFALLVWVGGRMVKESLHVGEEICSRIVPGAGRWCYFPSPPASMRLLWD